MNFLLSILSTIAGYARSAFSPIFQLVAVPVGFIQRKALENDKIRAKLGQLTHEGDCIAHMRTQAMKTVAHPVMKDRALLIQGDYLGYAQTVYAADKYPLLYSDSPDGIEVDIAKDGLMPDGASPAVRLAGGQLTPEYVVAAWGRAIRASVGAGIASFVIGLVLCALAMIVLRPGAVDAVADGSIAQSSTSMPLDIGSLASSYEDIWTTEQAASLRERVAVVDNSALKGAMWRAHTESWISTVLLMALLLAGNAVFSIAIGRLWFLGTFVGDVFAAVDATVNRLRDVWINALRIGKFRQVERQLHTSIVEESVAQINKDDHSPVICLGTGTAIAKSRGHLNGLGKGEEIKMSILDMQMHIQAYGGTGTGKTAQIIKPVLQQLFAHRKSGYPISFFVMDAKGVLSAQILKLCRKNGIGEDEILTIGTEPGNAKIDIFAGMEPAEIAGLIGSVADQESGPGGGDPMWSKLAKKFMTSQLTVCLALKKCAWAKEWEFRNGVKLYTPIALDKFSKDSEEIVNSINALMEALDDVNGEYELVKEFDHIGLRSGIEWLVNYFLPMKQSAPATYDGIVTNVSSYLSGFSDSPKLAEGFADGNLTPTSIPISALLDNKIRTININTDKYGAAGRLTIIFIKSVLFKLAKIRQAEFEAEAEARDDWWRNPVLEKDGSHNKHFMTFFIADEYQLLVTAAKGGDSDSEVWNVLRSAGIAGVIATQSISAYVNSIGREATDNMVNCFRSFVILPTSDQPTLDYAKNFAGKAYRSFQMEWEHQESLTALEMETGISVKKLPTITQIPGARMKFGPMKIRDWNDAYSLDNRFLMGYGDGGDSELRGAKQAAYWRQEDRTMSIKAQAPILCDVFEGSDLNMASGGYAFMACIRGKKFNLDLVKLPDRV